MIMPAMTELSHSVNAGPVAAARAPAGWFTDHASDDRVGMIMPVMTELSH